MDKYIVQGSAQSAEENQRNHLEPQHQDQMQVACAAISQTQYPVIYNAAHDPWLYQVHHDLAYHENGRKDGKMKIFFYIILHNIVLPVLLAVSDGEASSAGVGTVHAVVAAGTFARIFMPIFIFHTTFVPVTASMSTAEPVTIAIFTFFMFLELALVVMSAAMELGSGSVAVFPVLIDLIQEKKKLCLFL